MTYELNSKAYILFAKIEIGVREFLIKLIKKQGVREWTKVFLGAVQMDSIKDIGKRIYDSSCNYTPPNIEDIYYSKVYKELKNQNSIYKGGNLIHPFYYLTWSDLISLINKTSVSQLIQVEITETSRNVLVNNLILLNPLRNDIAHSRFISDQDYIIIKSSFEQIAISIPNFNEIYKSQSYEKSINELFNSLDNSIDNISECLSMLDFIEINAIEALVNEMAESFWISTVFNDLSLLIADFKNQLIIYKKYRAEPGGLLKLQRWKKDNFDLLANLKKNINGREI